MIKNPDFLIIPHQLILDKKLQPLDRILYGVIYWLVKLKNEKCNASNKTLKELCGCKTDRAISNSLNKLEKYKYIGLIYKDNKKRNRLEIIPLIAYGKIPIEQMMTRDRTNDDTLDRTNDEQNNKSIIRKDNNKATASAVAVDHKEIGRVIDLFKSVSPLTYKKFFAIPPERKAAAELLSRFPFGELELIIRGVLPQLNLMPYVGKDCKAFKPTELLRNIDKIRAKIKELQLKGRGQKVNIEI